MVAALPKELADFADVVGVVLAEKLHDTLKVSFALEARRLRKTLLSALKDFSREDSGSVEYTDGLGSSSRLVDKSAVSESSLAGARRASRQLHSSHDGQTLSVMANESSESYRSARSPPQSRHKDRLTSGTLQKRLADKVIAFKLLNAPEDSAGRHPSRKDRKLRMHFEEDPCTMSKQDSRDSPTRLRPLTKQSSLKLSALTPGSGRTSLDSSASSSVVPIGSPDSFLSSQEGIDNGTEDGRLSPRAFGVSSVSSSIQRGVHRSISVRSNIAWKKEAHKFYGDRQGVGCKPRGPAHNVVSIFSRGLGLLPWDVKFVWLSRMYQFALFMVLILCTFSVVTRLSLHDIQTNSMDIISYIDNALAVGSLLGFVACILKNHAFIESQFLVEAYLSRVGVLEELNRRSCIEKGALLLGWILCLASQLYTHRFDVHVGDLGFAFNVLVLLGTCAYALRLCRGLNYILDSFCEYIMDMDFDVEDAMQEWFLLHCTIRTACASLQWCFVVLQLTAVTIAIFGATLIYLGHESFDGVMLMRCIPGALCMIILLQLSMRAAFVSDLCKRVPMFVNSSNGEFDLKRTYLVDYIFHCETGFYIFEVRLNSAMLLKSLYVACAAAVGLIPQFWSELR